MTSNIEVNISGAIAKFKKAKINVAKATKNLHARLAFMGERRMKGLVPVRTGTLRRSIHAYPTRSPFGIATSVDYARIANVRSSRPRFIELTIHYLNYDPTVKATARKIIEAALK